MSARKRFKCLNCGKESSKNFEISCVSCKSGDYCKQCLKSNIFTGNFGRGGEAETIQSIINNIPSPTSPGGDNLIYRCACGTHPICRSCCNTKYRIMLPVDREIKISEKQERKKISEIENVKFCKYCQILYCKKCISLHGKHELNNFEGTNPFFDAVLFMRYGFFHFLNRNFDIAIHYLEKTFIYFDNSEMDSGPGGFQNIIQYFIASSHQNLKDLEKAIESYKKLVTILQPFTTTTNEEKKSKNRVLIKGSGQIMKKHQNLFLTSLFKISECYYHLGNPSQVIKFGRCVYDYLKNERNWDAIFHAINYHHLLHYISACYIYLEDFMLGMKFTRKHLESSRKLGYEINEAKSLLKLGVCLRYLQRFDESFKYLSRAKKLMDRVDKERNFPLVREDILSELELTKARKKDVKRYIKSDRTKNGYMFNVEMDQLDFGWGSKRDMSGDISIENNEDLYRKEFEKVVRKSKKFEKKLSERKGKKVKCKSCGKDEKSLEERFKRCGGCRKAYYCSRKCQMKDWKTHKKECRVK